ncbi:MAG: SURF1 family protein [Betaproteobacteria bacterium]
MSDSTSLDGHRQFRPGLWPTLAALIVVIVTILLGNWQARRADARGALQMQSGAMSAQDPLQLHSASEVSPPMRYRRVAADGVYVAERQIWLDNRTYKGAAGFYVLAPLRLDDGSHVLVNRGWIAATARHTAPAAPPPSGRTTVAGRLNRSPPSFLELQHVPPTGPVWQNLDLFEYARLTGLTPAPLVIEQTSAAADGLVRDWPVPDAGREKNLSYMWQWYGFAALTILLWLVLNWRMHASPAPGIAREQ